MIAILNKISQTCLKRVLLVFRPALTAHYIVRIVSVTTSNIRSMIIITLDTFNTRKGEAMYMTKPYHIYEFLFFDALISFNALFLQIYYLLSSWCKSAITLVTWNLPVPASM